MNNNRVSQPICCDTLLCRGTLLLFVSLELIKHHTSSFDMPFGLPEMVLGGYIITSLHGMYPTRILCFGRISGLCEIMCSSPQITTLHGRVGGIKVSRWIIRIGFNRLLEKPSISRTPLLQGLRCKIELFQAQFLRGSLHQSDNLLGLCETPNLILNAVIRTPQCRITLLEKATILDRIGCF